MNALDHLVEQLWGPALQHAESALRVAVNAANDETWVDVERYWLIPRAESARLLVPVGPRPAAARLLTNYRAMRPLPVNLARNALGTAVRAGLPLSRDTVAVQVRRTRPEAVEHLPLTMLAHALGRPVAAATGVRTSDNRKTTLHLVDHGGRPLGYAKVGWNELTNGFVRNETRVLRAVGGRAGPAQAPAVVAALDYLGNAVLVTAPLPLSARGRPAAVTPPTPQELFALNPVIRRDALSATGQVASLGARLRDAQGIEHVDALARAALALLERVAANDRPLPVAARWHGDLTPWNCAREPSGQLWVWDWESAEDDAAAGLDGVHWAFGRRRLTASDVDRMDLRGTLHDAEGYLAAAGVPRADRPAIAALYAVTVVERAVTLASRSGTWTDAFIGPSGLQHLLDEGTHLLSA